MCTRVYVYVCVGVPVWCACVCIHKRLYIAIDDSSMNDRKAVCSVLCMVHHCGLLN